MGSMGTFQPAPPAAISRVLSTFDRHQLEGFIAVALDLLDLADGDPDLEDATDTEDDFSLSPLALHFATGPGCSVSDPGGAAEGEDDEEDDHSGQSTEDEVSYGNPNFGRRGPGCEISDPAERGDLIGAF